MNTDLVNAIGKWAIVVLILAGSFVLLYQGKGDGLQPWSAISLIVGWVIRDSAGSSATTNAVKTIVAANPSYQAPPPAPAPGVIG